VKRLLLLVVACSLLASPAAFARDAGQGFGWLAQAQGQTKKNRPGQNPRGDHRDKGGGHDRRHQGRLTQEERQELHRDLDRANREIYRR